MAELSGTELQAAIVMEKNTDVYLSWERRVSEKGALMAYLKGAGTLFPADLLNASKKSPTQLVKIPVFNKQSTAIATARACAITRGSSVSALKTITPTTKAFTVSVAPSINAGNYLSDKQDFMNQFFYGTEAVYDSLDTAAIAALEANKNTALATSSLYTSITANAYVVPSADLYLNADALMKRNKLTGPYYDIANLEASRTFLNYMIYGTNNQSNLQGVLNGSYLPGSKYIPYLSYNLAAPASPNKETHYMVPEGTVGLFVWNTWEAKTGATTSDGKKWYTITDPKGLTWNVYEYSACVDLSATYGGGREQVPCTNYEFSLDTALVNAYSSDASSNIIKFTVS